MIAARIRTLANDLPTLPTLPEVATQIVEVSASDRSCAGSLGSIIEKDLAVTTRVLRLANSSFYRRSREITGVRQAVVVLGFETIRLLALSVAAMDAIDSLGLSDFDMHDFWMHSFGAAVCSNAIQEEIGACGDPALCFSSALLHDVGKCILAATYGSEYTRAMKRAVKEQRRVAAIETELFGTHHGEVASWVCSRWGCPVGLGVIANNAVHEWNQNIPFPVETRVVALAEQISRIVGFGAAGDPREPCADENLMRAVGISDSVLGDLLPRMAGSREDVARTLAEWKN